MNRKHKLLLVIGDNNDDGKTIAMLSLIEAVNESGILYTVIDADTSESKSEIPGWSHYHASSSKILLRDKCSCEQLLELAKQSELMVVGLSASTDRGLIKMLTSDSSISQECDLEVYVIGIISSNPASLVTIMTLAEFLQGSVRYVIAMTRCKGELDRIPSHEIFSAYYNSTICTKFRAAFDPVEIQVSTLDDSTLYKWASVGGFASVAKNEKNPPFFCFDGTRLYQFVDRCNKAWKPLIDVLLSRA